ncbi:glycosyltransferase family 4 protein [Cognatiyoonia sp. IB215446]|uniref:glycosyltransferase family 4 protein n=1 Tax=Cognatiyoonia sp. IB215446 TaxID=3097355 RepID=UPI002A0F3FE6|nr:glycosyltransferase family 4 protein [Cognatiyoonia sp. IB215446]MDX8349850.1 glycosyltransferase family 4 protein [Cognatiyoonia sp. IB215446]
MKASAQNELIILPVLKATRGPRGGLVLTQKYLNGAAAYAKTWPGPVTSLIALTDTPTTDMDQVEVLPGEAETTLEMRPTEPEALAARIKNAALVSGFLSPYELPTAELCQKLDVPIAFVSEYSLQTELQIIRSETRNPILRFRRKLWTLNAERKRREVLKLAAGLQCSGTPTYNAYKDAIANTLLFFDNRVPRDAVISDAALARKVDSLTSDRSLRLIFGGRLVAMKGVLDLVPFAAALRKRGVNFTLDIYGDGPLRDNIAKQINDMGLSDLVRLRGVVDFETEWVPTLKEQADLFVCCHPQGDPSSTYPEVMACGVPIVGYDNEALKGIIEISEAGWATPMHDIATLADTVTRLAKNRAELADAATNARTFAAKHAFEATMVRRTRHLIEISRLPAALKE